MLIFYLQFQYFAYNPSPKKGSKEARIISMCAEFETLKMKQEFGD